MNLLPGLSTVGELSVCGISNCYLKNRAAVVPYRAVLTIAYTGVRSIKARRFRKTNIGDSATEEVELDGKNAQCIFFRQLQFRIAYLRG